LCVSGVAAVFCRLLCLCWYPAADLKVLWTEGHDKLGVGVTKNIIRYHGTSFLWEARVPVSTGKGRQTEMMDKAVGPGRECVSKSMSAASSRDRRGDLTS
jgi:hypothetical protein